MKSAVNRFAGLVLFVALLAGTPLLFAKSKGPCRDRDGDKDDRGCRSVSMPDSHGGPLLALTAGALGVAMLVQRRRRIAS
jgi:MYXO-CTERM domain-containing protein